MKELLKKKGLNWENWHYVKDAPTELHIIHKHSMKTRIIEKEAIE
jgi:hypothetical protein